MQADVRPGEPGAPDPPGSLDHTLAELARLGLLIRREVLRQRLRDGRPASDEFRGLYIADDEVDALLDAPLSTSAIRRRRCRRAMP